VSLIRLAFRQLLLALFLCLFHAPPLLANDGLDSDVDTSEGQASGYTEICDDDEYDDDDIPENEVATKYENGRMAFLFGQYEVAYKAWLPLVELGYAKAQASMAWMYQTGNGVKKDLSKALELYRKAADQEHSIAQNNLGVFYEKGIVVPVDEKEAAKWYRKAAEVGYSYAQYNLGMLYVEGRGVEQDLKEAKYWLRIASRQGVNLATEELQKLQSAPPEAVKPKPKPAIAHAPYHSNPVTKGLAWIEGQKPNHYTIQLARSKDIDWILKLASSSRLEQPLVQFRSQSKGEEWYNLIYGSFATKDEAQQAARLLPEALRRWTPWVRPFADVRRQMLKSP
jgi:TPR repeat protein